MKVIRKFLSEFSNLDFYGVDQKMTFFRKEKYKSCFGSLLSLFFIAYFFYKIISFIIKSTNKQTFTQVNNIFTQNMELNITEFQFSHCLWDDLINGVSNFYRNISDYSYNNRTFLDLFYISFPSYIDYETIFEYGLCKDMKNHFSWEETDIVNGENKQFVNKVIKETCACGRIKPNVTSAIIFSDLYRYNSSSFNYKIHPKPSFYQSGEADKGFLFSVFKNNYFDYSQKNPIATAPLILLTNTLDLLTKEINLSFNKIRYSEIIDFDIFYSNTEEYENYIIDKNVAYESSDPKKSNNAMFSFNIGCGNTVFQYDITILSMDNILSAFNGVFQVLSIALGFFGNFVNDILFEFQKRRYFGRLGHKDGNSNRFWSDPDIFDRCEKDLMQKVYNYAKEAVEERFLKGNKYPQLRRIINLSKKRNLKLKNENYNDNISKIHSINDNIKNRNIEIEDIDNNKVNNANINVNNHLSNYDANSERNLKFKSDSIPPQKDNIEIEMEEVKLDEVEVKCENSSVINEIKYNLPIGVNVELERINENHIANKHEANTNNNNNNNGNENDKTISKKKNFVHMQPKNNQSDESKVNLKINQRKRHSVLTLIEKFNEEFEQGQITKFLFEKYVNSFEFLYDVFSQIEMLKILLLDENEYLDFKHMSRNLISIIDRKYKT